MWLLWRLLGPLTRWLPSDPDDPPCWPCPWCGYAAFPFRTPRLLFCGTRYLGIQVGCCRCAFRYVIPDED